ncbi:unnamed protein product [Symbiodinium natans]|uniref:Uncharacterized protein n=1 Tax=Symbiodinium natans TaxID=878477 RepID=A0A812SVW6_9DINO|nr:unnamed protein product [Symbiodinium natans]
MPVCSKCGTEQVEGRQKSSVSWVCVSCDRLQSYLAKLQTPASFDNLSSDDLATFYKQASAMKENGRFKFDRVRAAMTQTISRTLERSSGETSFSPFYPLSVWQQKGYDVQRIQQHGTKRESKQLGDTWSVRLEAETSATLLKQAQAVTATLSLRPRHKPGNVAEPALEEVLEAELSDEQSGKSEQNGKAKGQKRKRQQSKLDRAMEKAKKVELSSCTRLATRVVSQVTMLASRKQYKDEPSLETLLGYKTSALRFLDTNKLEHMTFRETDYQAAHGVLLASCKKAAKAKSKRKPAVDLPKEVAKEQKDGEDAEPKEKPEEPEQHAPFDPDDD